MIGGGGVASAPLGQLSAASARRFRPYPAYQDSGVEWLGETPAHWEMKPLKYFLRSSLAYGVLKPDKYDGDDGVRLIRILDVESGHVHQDQLELISPEQSAEFQRTVVRSGDLIVSVFGTIGRAFIVSLSLEGANLSRALARVQLKPALDSSLLEYWFSSTPFASFVELIPAGTAQRVLNLGDPAEFVVVAPTELEQRAIAAFLDRETARIDALVARKERLIELLQEKRSALITRAVTKGLDPNVPMKDSGVEWLEEIPAHWEVMKTTWLFSIGSGTSPRSEDPAYYGGDTPWVTTSELRESVVDSTEKSVTEEALRDLPSLVVHPKGRVAVAMYGATIGRLGILGVDAAVNQACCVFSRPRGIDAKFWFFWLQMRRPHLISLGYGGGQPNLSQELLRSMRVPTPPEADQRAIAAFLDRETAKLYALAAKVREAIDRLQEFRSALISAAVTGKIDVREQVQGAIEGAATAR